MIGIWEGTPPVLPVSKSSDMDSNLLQIRRVLIFAVAIPLCLRATEKHWIAHEAQAIVVGTLHPSPTFPWFDGWHVTGVIEVDEVLYGDHSIHRMNFRLVCPWESCARWPWWPPPRYFGPFLQRGLWFLRRIGENTWEPANGLFDSGFRFLSDRAYWENYIRRYKR